MSRVAVLKFFLAGLAASLMAQTRDKAVAVNALEKEIKEGKVKLPDHPTTGFRMAGPAAGYDAAANTVSSKIEAWQMIIIPFATGASLGLPDKDTKNMPWVMGSGTWSAHVMVEH
jgi:hypothetical protein